LRQIPASQVPAEFNVIWCYFPKTSDCRAIVRLQRPGLSVNAAFVATPAVASARAVSHLMTSHSFGFERKRICAIRSIQKIEGSMHTAVDTLRLLHPILVHSHFDLAMRVNSK